MKKYAFLFTVLFLLCSLEGISQNKKYQSLLWEIKHPKLEKTSYLYGTMHVSKKVAFHLSDTFFLGIKNADVIALELNPETWLRDMYESELVNSTLGSINKFSGWGGDNFYDKALNILPLSNKQIEYTLSTDPNVVNSLLYRFSGRNANFEENTYLDLFIYQSGKKQGKEIKGLEIWKTTSEILEKAMAAQAKEKRKDYSVIRRIQEKEKKSIYELIEDCYRDGDLDYLDSLSRLTSSDGYHKYMIDVRNEIMASGMDSIMQSGKSLFTGVGAAHLPNTNGVIELLREKGYTVRPVKKKISSKADKMKKKIEKSYFTHSLNPYTSPDGRIEVATHDDPYAYTLRSFMNNYVLPDMANGGYFAINRAKTYMPLENQTQEHYKMRVDSLLFEYIPGDIVKKTEFVDGNIIGFNILNKTKRGDYQRYRIAITPLELFIIKNGGTGKNILKNSDKTFNSIKFIPPAEGWSNYSPEEGGFEVNLPNYKVNGGNVNPAAREFSAAEQEQNVQSYDAKDGNFYMIIKNFLVDYDYLEEDTFNLRQLAERFEGVEDSIIIESEHTTIDGYPAYSILVDEEDSDRFLHIKTIAKGNQYYLLLAKTATKEAPKKFFDSFKFKAPKYENNLEEREDTTLKFKAMSYIEPPKNEMFRRITQMSSDEENPFEEKMFYSEYETKTSENVYIQYYKYGKYREFENIDSLWNLTLDNHYGNTDLNLISKKECKLDTFPCREYIHGDSNSITHIRSRYIVDKHVLYSLITSYDSISGMSDYQKNLFETFRPLPDTANEYGMFGHNTGMIFADLLSNDSLRMHSAMELLEDCEFKTEDFDGFVKVLDSLDFEDEFKEADRNDFIEYMGNFKHKDKVNYLKKRYKSTDESNEHLSILYALAETKTKDSYKAIKELLDYEIPLVENNSKIYSLFNVFEDTLGLSKTLYPQLLTLMEYDEYESDVNFLMYLHLKNELIKPSVYASKKAKLLRDANNMLKRTNSKEESDNSYYGSRKHQGNYKMRIVAKLLYPFRNEPNIKRFFDKVVKSDDYMVRTRILAHLIDKDEKIDTNIVNEIVEYEPMIADVYDEFIFVDSTLKYFPERLKDQKIIYKSLIQDSYSFDYEKDSVKYITKKYIKLKEDEGYVYFFKTKGEEDEYWKLNYLGLSDTTSKTLDYIPLIKKLNVSYEEKEEKKEIEDITKELFYWDRKYATPKNNYGGGFSFF